MYEYEPRTSRVSRIRYKVPEYQADYIDASYLANDTTARTYDALGNAVSGWKRGWQTDYRKEESRSYYGAGDRLAAVRCNSLSRTAEADSREVRRSIRDAVQGPMGPGGQAAGSSS